MLAVVLPPIVTCCCPLPPPVTGVNIEGASKLYHTSCNRWINTALEHMARMSGQVSGCH